MTTCPGKRDPLVGEGKNTDSGNPPDGPWAASRAGVNRFLGPVSIFFSFFLLFLFSVFLIISYLFHLCFKLIQTSF
jgi:hypothetical protein